jgi:tryptophan-rich sensory protein
MNQLAYTILFLVINFGGLAIGNLLMNNGPQSLWYQQLEKAPWTPPGIVFGIAWTLIMLCFSIYLSKLFVSNVTKEKVMVFIIQFLLNVSWNYIFFNQHLTFIGFICITLLTTLIFMYFFMFSKNVKNYKFLLLPYMIWLCIATSLNFYIVVHN